MGTSAFAAVSVFFVARKSPSPAGCDRPRPGDRIASTISACASARGENSTRGRAAGCDGSGDTGSRGVVSCVSRTGVTPVAPFATTISFSTSGMGAVFAGSACASGFGAGAFTGATSASICGAYRGACAAGTAAASGFGAASSRTFGPCAASRSETCTGKSGAEFEATRGSDTREVSTTFSAAVRVTTAVGTARTSVLPTSAATSAIEAASSNALAEPFFSSSRAPSAGLPCSPPDGDTVGGTAGFATAANNASKPSTGVSFFTDFAKPCA